LSRGQGLTLKPFADLGLDPPPLHARYGRSQVRARLALDPLCLEAPMIDPRLDP
jgi:hypothetical protein